jgi:hypothetical protein
MTGNRVRPAWSTSTAGFRPYHIRPEIDHVSEDRRPCAPQEGSRLVAIPTANATSPGWFVVAVAQAAVVGYGESEDCQDELLCSDDPTVHRSCSAEQIFKGRFSLAFTYGACQFLRRTRPDGLSLQGTAQRGPRDLRPRGQLDQAPATGSAHGLQPLCAYRNEESTPTDERTDRHVHDFWRH